MSIVAHPDDQEFSVAGTLAKWAKAGCEITSVLITSGDSGSNDPTKGADYKTDLARLRETEQLSANEMLGVKQTVFLRYPDGELEPSIALRKDLTKVIRQYKPEVVFAGNPEAWFYGNEYINHPDHRAAARAAAEAVFPQRGRGSFLPTCSKKDMSRTKSANYMFTAQINPIHGSTSARQSISR